MKQGTKTYADVCVLPTKLLVIHTQTHTIRYIFKKKLGVDGSFLFLDKCENASFLDIFGTIRIFLKYLMKHNLHIMDMHDCFTSVSIF